MSASIQEIKAKHTPQLMAMPGVVSVGLGRDPAGDMVIVVGVERDTPGASSEIPPVLDGYRVVVQVIGPVRPL